MFKISRLALSSSLLLFGIAHAAHADWFFRGTPNSWTATPLTLIGGTNYETCQTFGTGDSNGGSRFKIDRTGNWSESYPVPDFLVNNNTSYRISFNSATKAITTQAISDCSGSGLLKTFPSLYFRGTANNWGTTPLLLVANNTWQLKVILDGQANQRFKFDVLGDWSQNYGDNNNDKYLDQTGTDIFQTGTGEYLITVNDATKLFSIVKSGTSSSSITSISSSSKTSSSKSSTSSSATTSSSSATSSSRSSTSSSSSAFTYKKNLSSLYFRGTPNNWLTSAMTLVADNTWQITLDFDDQANQRFKFTVGTDWSQAYGDRDLDSVLEAGGPDIYQTGAGAVKLTVNDLTLAYQIEVPPCTSNCGQPVTSLGAVYSSTKTVFSLWSPDASNVNVKVNGQLYSMKKIRLDASQLNGYKDVYQAVVQGDLHLAEYSFVVNGTEVRDPYAKMAKPLTNSSIVMDMSRTQLPNGWSARPALASRESSIIYEMHVRDFTIDSSSGVSAARRGKFLGLVQAGTTNNGVKTGIDHLKELGITHVQLLPVYDFHSCDGLPDSDPCYNWGYDPRNFNVPEDRYSATPLDYENRAREFKTMVDEFHKAGIRVVMDVVYNHTHSKDMLNPITGKYYTATDLSGCCGNSLNSDQPMVSRLIQDSLEYWVEEYGIDGFRFDLMGVFGYAEADKWGKYLNAKYPDRNLLIYGEPWTGASDPDEARHVRYGTTPLMAEGHVGVFNGAFRDSIKGDNRGTAKGYMYNNTSAADNGVAIVDGSKASPYNANDSRNGIWFRNFAEDPEQTINYISAHDDLNMWDKIYLSLATNVSQDSSHQLQSITPPADLALAKRIANFGVGIVLTSQGIPMIYSGDEFLRSKTNNGNQALATAWNYGSDGGAFNSFSSPDSYNAMRWGKKTTNANTFKYFKDAISLRKARNGLHLGYKYDIAQYVLSGNPAESNGELVTNLITSPADSADIFVVYNSGTSRYVNLPAGSWTQVFNSTGATNVTGLSSAVIVEGTTVTVFTKAR